MKNPGLEYISINIIYSHIIIQVYFELFLIMDSSHHQMKNMIYFTTDEHNFGGILILVGVWGYSHTGGCLGVFSYWGMFGGYSHTGGCLGIFSYWCILWGYSHTGVYCGGILILMYTLGVFSYWCILCGVFSYWWMYTLGVFSYWWMFGGILILGDVYFGDILI